MEAVASVIREVDSYAFAHLENMGYFVNTVRFFLYIRRPVVVNNIIMLYQKTIQINQLHAVSRTQQGRQREPNVKTHRSPLFAEFWRYCVMSSGT